MNLRSILSLKVHVIVALFVFLSTGAYVGAIAGGDVLTGSLTPLGSILTGVVALAAAAFLFVVAKSTWAQRAFVAPSRVNQFSPKAFYFFSILLVVMALLRLVVAYQISKAHLFPPESYPMSDGENFDVATFTATTWAATMPLAGIVWK